MSRLVPSVILATLLAGTLVGCSSAPPPAPAPAPAPPRPTGPTVTLDGDDLGVTKIGADFRTAVSAVSTVLGPPTADPAGDVACVASVDEVAWGQLRLASSDGKLAGWLSLRPDLKTAKGITVGSTVADVLGAYGDTVTLRAGTPDTGETFAAVKAGLAGGITSQAPDGTVSYLYNGVCSPS